MQLMNVVNRQRVIVCHPNCLECEAPLSPELSPIGYCETCLSEEKYMVFDSEKVYAIFTLRELKGWPVKKISDTFEMDLDDVVSILQDNDNRKAWKSYKASLFNV